MDETRKTLMIFTAFQELESKGFELKDGVLSSSRFTIDIQEDDLFNLFYRIYADDDSTTDRYQIKDIIRYLNEVEEIEKNHLAVLQKRAEFWSEISDYQIEIIGDDRNVFIDKRSGRSIEFDTLSDKVIFDLILRKEINHAKFAAKEEIRLIFKDARDILGL